MAYMASRGLHVKVLFKAKISRVLLSVVHFCSVLFVVPVFLAPNSVDNSVSKGKGCEGC